MLCRASITLPTGRTLKIDNADREILVGASSGASPTSSIILVTLA
jgi:hypothetical protein